MGVRIEIDLSEEEAAFYGMYFREVDCADPAAKWSPSSLAKSLVLAVVLDDLEMSQKQVSVQ